MSHRNVISAGGGVSFISVAFINMQLLYNLILEFPAPKKLTTRNAVRDKQTIRVRNKQTILSPFIELTN